MSEPTTDDHADPIKHAWNDVADSFSALGRSMKDRFERDPDAEHATTGDHGSDPTAALREAFEQLLAAGRDLGDKVTGITRDDRLKGRARSVGTSINHAVEATINQITGEMRSFFKGSTGDDASPDATGNDGPPTVIDGPAAYRRAGGTDATER
ncbi:MAG: hypothetical protein ACK5OX_04675 [Desertimonas sp.]